MTKPVYPLVYHSTSTTQSVYVQCNPLESVAIRRMRTKRGLRQPRFRRVPYRTCVRYAKATMEENYLTYMRIILILQYLITILRIMQAVRYLTVLRHSYHCASLTDPNFIFSVFRYIECNNYATNNRWIRECSSVVEAVCSIVFITIVESIR